MSELVTLPVPSKQNCPCGRICDDHAMEAKLIQSSLVPATGLSHDSVEIAFRSIPFSEVGGDFADFFCLPDGLIGIYLGDVVGKGLPAAMYSALVMGTLRGIHKTGTNTADVLTCLNERLVQRPLPGRFCSTLYALFVPSTRELIFYNPLLGWAPADSLLDCFPAPPTTGTSSNSRPGTAFCLPVTVSTNRRIHSRSNSARTG
jgi:hypothetical protein